MAIDRVPVMKRCRALGIEPAVVGVAKESHRQLLHAKNKVSEYGAQLKEKQKAKFIYGVLEKQFRLYYEKAKKMPGITGENLLILLERRLDNVVYRMGLASTRRQARQLVTHGHIAVNGKRVDIPSALIKVGDVVSVMENSLNKAYFKGMNEKLAGVTTPAWLVLNAEALNAKVDRFPTREEIDVPVVEQSIVELYSK
ncbi:MAG: 30S ribosomal protein S4 [Succiniclasticum sp.]|nr:30S ribosomal protein S4 [Succiniclasticum sp.]MDY6304006.1 30S ribosomal protein S4 [Succiniclasticum sp.]